MARNSAQFGLIIVVLAIGITIGISVSPLLINLRVETVRNQPILATNSATIHVAAVSLDQKGVLGTATIEIMPGHGRTLLNANPFVEPDTQESMTVAKLVAMAYTNISLDESDVIVSFNLPVGNSTAQLVGGPSAGAAMTIAMIAAMTNQTVRPDVAVSGTILDDGRIGKVSGILEKSQAAGEGGIKTFIIPVGEGTASYYEKVVDHTSENGYAVTLISYAPRQLSINNYTEQWGMTTTEVPDIAQAVKYAIAVR